jgi:hypothetical protein
MDTDDKMKFTRFPVVSRGAECLVMGHLMRRNILAYKAPPNNEGYDLICIHPDPRRKRGQIRVQVKSRFATDCDRSFLVKRRSLNAFDYLIVAFLNVGYFVGMAKRVSKKLVPKGKLDRQWNLIVRACRDCNRRKSALEDDISAITMQPDTLGIHAVDDIVLIREAVREGGG